MQDVVKVTAGTRQTVQLRHHDRIARQQRLHQLGELGTAIPGLAGLLLAADLLAAAAFRASTWADSPEP